MSVAQTAHVESLHGVLASATQAMTWSSSRSMMRSSVRLHPRAHSDDVQLVAFAAHATAHASSGCVGASCGVHATTAKDERANTIERTPGRM